MRFAISSEQKDFFHKNQYICFEDVLSASQIDSLIQAIETTLGQKKTFKNAHDLFRKSDAIKKTTQKSSLTAIASELFDLWKLRIAFDQYVTASAPAPFEKEMSLSDISSIGPLAGAMLIQLKTGEPSGEFPLPKTAGSVLFFSPQMEIPWPELRHDSFFLVVFAKEKAFFRADTPDPHAVDLKNLGYVFGDKLNDTIHPLIYRRNV